MATSDRKPFETATVLDQDFLDESHDNLLNQLELIVDIQAPDLEVTGVSYLNPTGTLVEINFSKDHRLRLGDTITVSNASDAALDGSQTVTDIRSETSIRFDAGAAFTTGTMDIVAERTIFVSDRNKYVGGTFYEARLKFPVINRTVGEFLSAQLQFSAQVLSLNNVDGRFNTYLPAGDNFDGWIGNLVTVKMGLRDVASTYKIIFQGNITDEGGFKRDVSTITLNARDKFEELNANFPSIVFTSGSFPNLEEDLDNVIVPIIYGDWTTNVEPRLASIPSYPVNGLDPNVDGTSGTNNVQMIISDNALVAFDTTEVYLKRGEKAWKFASSEIVTTGGFPTSGATNSRFEIIQNGANMTAITVDEVNQPYVFDAADEILVKVRGKDLGAYDDNIIEQARDILITYTDSISADFDSNWNTFRDKTVGGGASIENAVGDFKSRIWIQEPVNALEFVLSLLEEVRLEVFVDINQKLKILSNHLDDFEASPAHEVKNWDVAEKAFKPQIDERNNFNRAKGQFNFLPNRNENFQETAVVKNTLAIDQSGKTISKRIIFPHLYDDTTAKNQVKEILRITSGYIENIHTTLTWRSMLLDIGDFVTLNINIQGTIFENVPAIIREIGYDPQGIKIPMRLWSFQMLPFPGHAPGFVGITGGTSATIVEE